MKREFLFSPTDTRLDVSLDFQPAAATIFNPTPFLLFLNRSTKLPDINQFDYIVSQGQLINIPFNSPNASLSWFTKVYPTDPTPSVSPKAQIIFYSKDEIFQAFATNSYAPPVPYLVDSLEHVNATFTNGSSFTFPVIVTANNQEARITTFSPTQTGTSVDVVFQLILDGTPIVVIRGVSNPSVIMLDLLIPPNSNLQYKVVNTSGATVGIYSIVAFEVYLL